MGSEHVRHPLQKINRSREGHENNKHGKDRHRDPLGSQIVCGNIAGGIDRRADILHFFVAMKLSNPDRQNGTENRRNHIAHNKIAIPEIFKRMVRKEKLHGAHNKQRLSHRRSERRKPDKKIGMLCLFRRPKKKSDQKTESVLVPTDRTKLLTGFPLMKGEKSMSAGRT